MYVHSESLSRSSLFSAVPIDFVATQAFVNHLVYFVEA